MTTHHDLIKQGSEDAAFRSTLRRERIIAREALSAEDHANKSAAVLVYLDELLLQRFQRAIATLGFYWPIRAEIDCRPLAITLIERGWRVGLPLINERHSAMTFRNWTPESPMMTGEHGIPTLVDGPLIAPDVLLIPVNVFDRQGYRLGYGGGYYDRTLAAMTSRPYQIGTAFALARAASIRPHAQDCALDAVVTECGVDFFA